MVTLTAPAYAADGRTWSTVPQLEVFGAGYGSRFRMRRRTGGDVTGSRHFENSPGARRTEERMQAVQRRKR